MEKVMGIGDVQALRDKLSELQRSADVLKMDNQSLAEDNEKLKKQMAEFEEERDRLNTKILELQADKVNLQQEIIRLNDANEQCMRIINNLSNR